MELVPIHHDAAEIREQCCQMLNAEWPRSETLRWRMLDSSRDDLPMSLALVQRFEQSVSVLGHARLSKIPSDPNAVWLESVVIHPDLRGQGWGKHLMLRTEEFCKSNLNIKVSYLCTIDQQIFYARCGYQPCEPVCAYSGNVKLPTNLRPPSGNSSDNAPIAKSASRPAIPSLAQTSAPAPPTPPPPPPPAPGNLNLSNVDCSDEEEKLRGECQKFYFRPELKAMPLLAKPLRSLVKSSTTNGDNSSAKQGISKDQICRAVIPKTFMKKIL